MFVSEKHVREDHYIAGLIGICVIIVALLSFCLFLIIYGIKNPTSIAGHIVQTCRMTKYRVFTTGGRRDGLTSSVANLTSEDHSQRCRRLSGESTITTTTSL
jgi:hypothetical protein